MSLGSPTGGFFLPPELLTNLRRIRTARRQGGCLAGCAHDRTDDSRLPWDTEGRYGGWGGHEFHGTDPGTERTPVVFVHGLQRDACDWEDHATFFLRRSYGGDALWAVTFRDGHSTHPSMARQLDEFVTRVCEAADADEVAVVAHSLGVTGVRHWMHEYDRYDRVETFVGLAGPNHGTVLMSLAAGAGLKSGNYRTSPFLRADSANDEDHPLGRLNEEETPGDVDYYTIRGTEDPLFWQCPESPELDGAENVALPVKHDEVRTSRRAKELVFEWIAGYHPYDLQYHVRPNRSG